jgi:molecular chaperone GrpE (heat shock protein)
VITPEDQDEIIRLREELASLHAKLSAMEAECATYRRRALVAVAKLDEANYEIEKLRADKRRGYMK